MILEKNFSSNYKESIEINLEIKNIAKKCLIVRWKKT